MNTVTENPIINAGVDVAENEVTVSYRANWGELKESVEWKVSPSGEIITDDPDYLPMIQEWMETNAWRDADSVRASIKKHGGIRQTGEDSQISELKERIYELWDVASSLRSIIDRYPYGLIRYPSFDMYNLFEGAYPFGEVFQETITYETAVTVLQKTEKDLFGKSITMSWARRNRSACEDSTKPPELPTHNDCQVVKSLDGA